MTQEIKDFVIHSTVYGMAIVLALLVLIFAIVRLYRSIKAASVSGQKAEREGVPSSPSTVCYDSSSEDDVIAVIAAAVATMYEGTGTRPVIRSIRPSGGSRPVWASAGLLENMRSFY